MELLATIGAFGFLSLTIAVLELFWMWYPFLAKPRTRHTAYIQARSDRAAVIVPVRNSEVPSSAASLTDKAA